MNRHLLQLIENQYKEFGHAQCGRKHEHSPVQSNPEPERKNLAMNKAGENMSIRLYKPIQNQNGKNLDMKKAGAT